jgi:hypothetical protein
MNIERVDFRSLRNNEHFQCQTEFKALVENYQHPLNIDALFNDNYLPLYAEEDEAILKISKNTFTEDRLEADRRRDMTFRGMVDMSKAALNHFDENIVASAKRLKILFDTYGNIAQLPLQEETSAIYNLLQELGEKYSMDASAAGLSPWIIKLTEDNNAYEELVKKGYSEEAAKTELRVKEVRTKIDKVFRQIIDRLEALMLIEGESNYIEFVKKLNVQLEKYSNILAQRQGRAAAKKES